mgnify:CR=1 FL=1
MSSTNRGTVRTPSDAYYTPATIANALVALLPITQGSLVLEPSAGGGAFVDAAMARGARVWAIDIRPEAPALHRPGLVRAEARDFLMPTESDLRPDWVIGNPPFTEFDRHLDRALSLAPNVGFLLRLAVMESAARVEAWATRWPLRHVWVLAERPSFTGGATDSTAYGFFWFQREWAPPATVTPGWSWKRAGRGLAPLAPRAAKVVAETSAAPVTP